ncbi:MAG TPA: PQQ-binding-like beta-propeller repeat protein [Bryobacteraceae bacterium]|nr:PQQ-binding-like beta-propeller repeat protein [Bryobacteraceae bacterium]
MNRSVPVGGRLPVEHFLRNGAGAIAILALLLAPVDAAAENWPDFRGPAGDGHSTETNVPVNWSEQKNIRWKMPLPGKGWSTPIITGNEIWLTTATDDNRSLRVLAIDATKGAILRNVEVFRLPSTFRGHEKNSGASPSVLIEGDRVYAHFGSYGTACLRRDGTVLWRNADLKFFQVHGPGGSPVLFEDLIIFNADGNDIQFVAALNKDTGKIVWRAPRPSAMAYSTPLIIRTPAGPQLISTGANRAWSYDPRSGKPLWWVNYEGFSNVPRPVFAHGMVYLCTGFYTPNLLAVRVDGSGDVTATHIVWRATRGVPLTPSPIVVNEFVYIVNDSGIASCYDAKTGKEQWRQRLPGTYSASPVFASAKIYFLNENGQTTVIASGGDFKKLASNTLEGEFLSSMGVSGRAFFHRSATHLYRIEE